MMSYPRFVAAGEALTDLIRVTNEQWSAKNGGATWNVARVMSALGVSSAFAGAVSQDCFGDALIAASREASLDMRFMQQQPASPLLAMVHETHPPQYFFVGDDSADLYFDPQALPAGWLTAGIWLHFGGISLARPRLASKLLQLARQAKQVGATISFDPNFRILMNEQYDPVFEEMSRLADVVKVSDEDLCGLFRTADKAAALARLQGWLQPEAWLLYTYGAAGATLIHQQQQWQQTPPLIEVLDTVGAGDASVGGLVYSLMQQPQASGETHLAWAIAAGAAACLAVGATPPMLEQIKRLLGK
ncbi:MAG: carbohydrate kinase [Proteobacteria bacterium]|nr:carbohydrate kinase [Pseudomonadota bacterium]